ncbi:hypothetical protein LguiA_010951 [Lonicera macranthoides]
MESSANTCFLDLEHCSYFSHNFSLGIPIEVKTADTGYMSRRLIKALEDLSVHYDNTVRNASTSIVQFTYGDDGMDPAQMEGKSGFPLNFDRLISKVKEEEKAIKNNELGATVHIDATAAFNQSTDDNEDNNDDNQGSQSPVSLQLILSCSSLFSYVLSLVGPSLALCPAFFSLPVLAFLLLFCEFAWWTLVLRLHVLLERIWASHLPRSSGRLTKDFLRKCTERSQSTRRELKLDEGQLTAGEELKLLENIAQNISGSTPRQLETWCTICLRPYEARILLKSPVGCELVAAPIRTQEES